jgi:hypothetical protein
MALRLKDELFSRILEAFYEKRGISAEAVDLPPGTG